jgi:microcin C transport system substrate-binding protein
MAGLLLALALSLPAWSQAPAWEKGTLPPGVKWLTNDSDPEYADPQAKKGGTLRVFQRSFPLSLRTVGPDSNDSFRTFLLANQTQLTYFHPNTRKPIPALATHWAYGADHKTIYFKLNPKAVWSDGVPVTAMDFAFGLEMMRSKHIVAPWYNEYYSTKFDKVVVYDDHTLAIVGAEKRSPNDMHYYFGFPPRPRHFHKLGPAWVKDTNWKVEPNTGPYQITKVEKGKEIVFERKKDWWGRDLRYFRNRYNVDRIVTTVIRDESIAYEHFRKGLLDGFPATIPQTWHERAVGEIYDKGWAHKLWFYTDRSLPIWGMWLNQDVALFKDKDVRLGFAHAMNVEKVLKTVLRGDTQRLKTNGEGYGKHTDRTIPERAFDLKRADEHLTKAGWGTRGPDGIRVKDGQRLTARVTYGRANHNDRLVVLKEEAKKAGVELTLQLLDAAAAFKTMLEKKHEIAYSGWAPQDKPEYWGQYHSKNAHVPQNNNFSNTDDAELDGLIDAWRVEFDEDKQAELSRKVQRRVYELGCFIPTWKEPYFRIAYWRWLKWPTPPATKTSEDPVTYAMAESEAWDGLYWVDEDVKNETLAAMKAGKAFPPVTKVDQTYKAE